jgi:hypothetical protein
MAADRSEGYYHLTPEGWRRQDQEPFPENRVETWRYEMEQPSQWSKEYERWSCVWASPDHSRQDRDALRTRFSLPTGKRKNDSWNYDVTEGEPL